MAASHDRDDAYRMVESVGGLVKSMGLFSLALGAFTVRQAGRLLTIVGADAAASIADASTAVSRRARTAIEVGANVQSGLVDAFVNLAGLGAQADAESGVTDLAVPVGIAATRRVTGMRTVGEGARRTSVRQAEFIGQLHEFHGGASDSSDDRDRIVAALWKSEGLAGSVARHLLAENVLSDAALARQVLPVIHVGFGSGSAEVLAFDPSKLRMLFDERCEEGCADFAYEGIGATLRFYERGFFKLVSAALDFIQLDAPEVPDPAGFFAGYLAEYPSRIQRLVAHGYGRIITFSHLSIDAAIAEAAALPCDRVEPAVHGVAFAFAMVNSPDLPHILRRSAIPHRPAVRAAFQNGLIYALVFLDWYMPGVLADWKPQLGLETELIEHARHEADLSRARGFPLAFRLTEPRA